MDCGMPNFSLILWFGVEFLHLQVPIVGYFKPWISIGAIDKVAMEEDEDRILLSSLGVTSANPEDIERNILSQVHSLFLFSDCIDKGV